MEQQLLCLDFSLVCSFTTPVGTEWRVYAAQDSDSWWHEEPICWEVFIARLSPHAEPRNLSSAADGEEEAAAPSASCCYYYVHGTLLSPGIFIRTEREWAAALERLLPGEGLSELEAVD